MTEAEIPDPFARSGSLEARHIAGEGLAGVPPLRIFP
jgi:hypothetical protein